MAFYTLESTMSIRPKAQGLYDPRFEHDACGIGAVVNISGRRDHDIVQYGKQVLLNLMHRGAAGADESTGDGAGILFQIPHEFFISRQAGLDFILPEPMQYGVAMIFLPRDEELRRRCEQILAEKIEDEGLKVLGWRDVPADNSCLGEIARNSEPAIRQVFIDGEGRRDEELERRLYVARRRAELGVEQVLGERADEFYIPSMSCRTICYKGMFLAPQLFAYYPDLAVENVKTSLAIVHQRYSTNTFPSWQLAQPFRMIAHNGEINTLRGNANRLQGYEKTMSARVDRRHIGTLPHTSTRRQRLGLLRQLHGASGPRRPIRPARPDDDDSRGLWVSVPHFHRQAGVLRISCRDHGALGRPGRHGIYRRPAGGRHPGPQRAATLPIPGHHRRPLRAGQRGGRDRVPARANPTERPSSARPHVPGRYRRRAGSSSITKSRARSPGKNHTAAGSRKIASN